MPPAERMHHHRTGHHGRAVQASWLVTAFALMALMSVLPDGLLLWPFIFGGLMMFCLALPMGRPRLPPGASGRTISPSSGSNSRWPTPNPAVRSPFDRPAFWDEPPGPANHQIAGQFSTPGLRTPPNWDPLGVAPFAWDLPEPPPLRRPTATWRPTRAATLVTGMLLLTMALAAISDFAGWWPH